MKRGLLSLILIFSTLLGMLFLVWPSFQKLKKLKLIAQKRKIELQRQEDYYFHLRETWQKLKEHQDTLEKIDTALPSEPEIARLLNFLSQLAQENGLLLNEIGPFATKKATFLKKKQFKKEKLSSRKELQETVFPLSLSGNYHSLKNFLEGLEKSARLIEVEEISFLPQKGELFQFHLNLRVYSY